MTWNASAAAESLQNKQVLTELDRCINERFDWLAAHLNWCSLYFLKGISCLWVPAAIFDKRGYATAFNALLWIQSTFAKLEEVIKQS